MNERRQDRDGYDDPCIVFALARERNAFAATYPTRKKLSRIPELDRLIAPDQRSVCCLLTGIGERRMRSAMEWLISVPRIGEGVYRPRLVLSAGFSGALHETLRVGDLVVATEVVHEAGGRWPASPLPERANFVCRRGVLLTSARFISGPDEKRTLAQRHGVLAVDMESAVAAEICHRHEIPFACLRVISDDAHSPLPPHLETIVDNGRVAPWPLLKRLVRSPGLALELWRLERQTRLAAQRLAEALAVVVNTMPK